MAPSARKTAMHEPPGTGHLSMPESPDAQVLNVQDFCRSSDGASR